jgi:hypothetical protein
MQRLRFNRRSKTRLTTNKPPVKLATYSKNQMSTKTIDLDRFKNAVGFTTTFCRWGNRRKGNMAKITTNEDATQDKQTKERLHLTKELIKAKEYEDICTFLGGLQKWIYEQTVPSFFKTGFQLVGKDGIAAIEARMRKAQTELAVLTNNLVAVFPAKIEEAKGKLGEQFNASDYPSVKELSGMFEISWNWIAFSVPEGLPEELRQAEQDKMEKQFADAGEQILQALREGFKELLAHAVSKLAVEPGEKPKVFRDSMIGNIQAFIDTFSQRNMMGDVELAQLVAQAKTVLEGVTPQKLRDYANVKDTTREQFVKIQGELEKMITERPARRFDFSEDSETPAAAVA